MDDTFRLSDLSPGMAGVYHICLDGRVSYVGEASDIRARLSGHGITQAKRVGVFRGVAFKELTIFFHLCDDPKRRLQIEAERIAIFKPQCNIRGVWQGRTFLPVRAVNVSQYFRSFVKDMGGQAKVATLLDLSPGHVSLLFNGKRSITPKLAERIEIATQGKYAKEKMVWGRK